MQCSDGQTPNGFQMKEVWRDPPSFMGMGRCVGTAVAREAGGMVHLGQLPAAFLLRLPGVQKVQHLQRNTYFVRPSRSMWAATSGMAQQYKEADEGDL